MGLETTTNQFYFRAIYNFPKIVEFCLVDPSEHLVGSPTLAVFPAMTVIEGGLCFPINLLLRCFLSRLRPAPTQIQDFRD